MRTGPHHSGRAKAEMAQGTIEQEALPSPVFLTLPKVVEVVDLMMKNEGSGARH